MKEPYSKWTREQKEKYIQTCTYRRWERKLALIAEKGGKCQNCGYNKCLRALSFHHRDPTQKSFPLDIRQMASRKMDALLAEVAKCDLLCLNCHMELEDSLETKYERF